jgi:hypothetical protein
MVKTPAKDRTQKKALDEALRALFGKLEAKPVSDRLKSVVEQLDASDRPAKKKAG